MSVTQLCAPVDVPSVGFFKQECFSIDVFLFCSNSVYVWLILCTRPPHLLPQKPAVLFALSPSLFLWSFLLILGHAALATKTWQLPQHLWPPQPPPFLVCMRCQPLVRLISQLWDNWKQCLFSWLKITAIWVYLGLFVPLFILLDILQLDNPSLYHSFQGAVKPALPSCLDGNSHLLIPEELLVASARNCSFGILTWVGTSSLFQTQRRAVSTLWEKSSQKVLMPFGWLPILGPTDNAHLSCLSPFCFQMCPDDLWPPPQIFQSWVCWVPPHWSRLWHSPHSALNIICIIAVFNSRSYCFFFFFPAHRNQCEIKTITNGKSYHFPDIEENPKNKHQGSKEYSGRLTGDLAGLGLCLLFVEKGDLQVLGRCTRHVSSRLRLVFDFIWGLERSSQQNDFLKTQWNALPSLSPYSASQTGMCMPVSRGVGIKGGSALVGGPEGWLC